MDDVRNLVDAVATGVDVFHGLVEGSGVGPNGIVYPDTPQPSTSEPGLEPGRADGLSRWSELAVFLGLVYPGLTDLAAKGAAGIGVGAPDYSGIPYRTSAWLFGLWELAQGRVDALTALGWSTDEL